MAQAGCYGLPTRLPELWGNKHGVRLEFVLFRLFLVLAIYLAYNTPGRAGCQETFLALNC